MAEFFESFQGILGSTDSPLKVAALLALLLASLSYLFFHKESVKVKLFVFVGVFMAALVLGYIVLLPKPPVPIPGPAPIPLPEPSPEQPNKIVISLDGQQSRSVGRWSDHKLTRNFECPRVIPTDFELVVVAERHENIGRRKGRCVTQSGFCNGAGESCLEFYFIDACYISSEWHSWYKEYSKGIGYSPQQVCADP